MDVVMRILLRTVVVFIVVIIHERPRLPTCHQGVNTIAYSFAAGMSTGTGTGSIIDVVMLVVVMFVRMVRSQSTSIFHCI